MFILCVAMCFCACAQGNDKTPQENDSPPVSESLAIVFDASLAKGRVIDTVLCKIDQAQSYALYLPAAYDTAKAFPCMIFFDAHARGALPLSLYKTLAEKYGFVFACSNTSKNGTEAQVSSNIIHTLIADLESRVHIDEKRIYTSGFSGGARVAAMAAMRESGIAGVIGCAAGFPQQQGMQGGFNYAGLAGYADFNLAEMEQLDEQLQQNGFNHLLLAFNGRHDWPPATDFEMAMLWQQVNAMKEHLQAVNDTIVVALKKEFDTRIAKTSGNDPITNARLLAAAIQVFGGISDAGNYQKQLTVLTNSFAYKNALVQQEQLKQQEAMWQQELSTQFPRQTVAWWQAKIAEFNKNTRIKLLAEARMYNRVLSYLSLVSYMYTDQALKKGDLANAINFLLVFRLADPQNSDGSYLEALYQMQRNDKETALLALQKAASMGYTDAAQMLGEPAFSDLHENALFNNILAQVKLNCHPEKR